MIEAIPTIWPLDRTKLTNSIGAYGYRIHPVYKKRIFHKGVDLTAPKNLPIYVTASGKVTFSGRQSGYGNIIVVDHGFGYKTKYAHLNKIHVKKGQTVTRGEHIGDLGATGIVSGAHLHYEVLYKNNNVNPINYLARNMTSEEYQEFIESVLETIYEQ
ncbi:MAG: M23 family metallopeptidase [Rikenellaceae bacterium]